MGHISTWHCSCQGEFQLSIASKGQKSQVVFLVFKERKTMTIPGQSLLNLEPISLGWEGIPLSLTYDWDADPKGADLVL